MLLSTEAFRRFSQALASGRMPLPRRGVPNDEHIATYARQLQVTCAHSNLFAYSTLPADARIVAVVATRLDRQLHDYTGPNTLEGVKRRADFSLAAVGESNGALDAQVMGAVVLHRVPERLMRLLYDRQREPSFAHRPSNTSSSS